MFKKRFIILIAAAMLISGCKAPEAPGFSFPDNSYEGSSDNSSDNSEVNSQSGESSSEDPAANTPSESENEPSVRYPESQDDVLQLFYDPANVCTMEIDGNAVIITVKTETGFIEDIFTDIESTVDRHETDGGFTYTVQPETYNGYFSLYLDNENSFYAIRLKSGADGISFPDVSEVIGRSRAVAENPVHTSPAVTAKFITRDGSTEKVPEILSQIKNISDKICEGIDSDYDKLRAISQWVSANIYYDHPAYKAGIPDACLSLEYMLDKHSSVCGGYSNMTSALCAAQGIYCVNINGEALNNGYCYAETGKGVHHEWNYAVIDGRGIWVDSGWNSYNTVSMGGTYSSDDIGYFYFDIGSEIFALNHAAVSSQYRDYFCPELYNGRTL